MVDRPVLQKSFQVVRLNLAQHVPDSGQEHLTDSDDCLFMTPAGFDPVIPLLYRMALVKAATASLTRPRP